MRKLIELTATGRFNFNGEPIFKASIGPYKYITTMIDRVLVGREFKELEVLAWCSSDGEPSYAVNSSKYDIKERI